MTAPDQCCSHVKKFLPRRRLALSRCLRGSPDTADPRNKMVLAEELGNADRHTSWREESDCGARARVGRGHAPHLEWWDRFLLEPARGRSPMIIGNQTR